LEWASSPDYGLRRVLAGLKEASLSLINLRRPKPNTTKRMGLFLCAYCKRRLEEMWIRRMYRVMNGHDEEHINAALYMRRTIRKEK
jgi:hypothetical protein